jgi:DNA-directed RNA polymerase beta' subunit
MSKLRVLSDVQVEAVAAFDITQSLDLHDPRFGNAGSTEVVCPTCGMRGDVCMGHHASLSLGLSMFHPLLYKESQQIINNVCFKCKKILERVTKSKAKKCPDCNTVNHGDYTIYANNMYVAVRPNSYKLASSIPPGVLPNGYVVSKVLVPPIHLRTPEDMEWSTDIQKLYEQLVHAVRRRGDVCTVYAKITGAHKNEGVTGIMSGKGGIFRKLMMGKRVEFSARAVVVGDPNVQLNEVAVPKSIADSIKVKIMCCDYNISVCKSFATNGALWWEDTEDTVSIHNILPGMTFQRTLANGDFVMLNRQPSLSRQSLACFKVVVRKDDQKVFGINPQSTSAFNADFDGDEMNTFFMSQSCPPMCKAEMVELCSVQQNAPVQDVVTGCHIMSITDMPVSREIWSDCIAIADVPVPEGPPSTRGLLAMCLPGYRGEVLNKNNIYTESVNLYKLQLVVERWLSTYGLTVESVRAVHFDKPEDETADTYREKCIERMQKHMRGTGLMSMIDSGAKGTVTHAVHMAVALGQQYVNGKEGTFCTRSYAAGLTPDEFFGHQMAAREGVVSTGVSTANTGYLNRRACKVMGDLKVQYNGTIADNVMLSSFQN